MATLNNIDLTINCRLVEEFAGSAVETQAKYTEDGRLFVFQRKKQKYRKLVLDCASAWLQYSTVKQLEALRDGGQAAILTHNDGRIFNVLLESIEASPIKSINKHINTSRFITTLNFIEI